MWPWVSYGPSKYGCELGSIVNFVSGGGEGFGQIFLKQVGPIYNLAPFQPHVHGKEEPLMDLVESVMPRDLYKSNYVPG